MKPPVKRETALALLDLAMLSILTELQAAEDREGDYHTHLNRARRLAWLATEVCQGAVE